MKKIILSLIIFSLFQLSYSQKKELKSAEKLIKTREYDKANIALESMSELINSTDNKTKAKYYYLKGLANYKNGEGSFENKLSSIDDFNRINEFEKVSSGYYSAKVKEIYINLFNSFVNDYKIALDNKNYKLSYRNLEAAFNVSKSDTLYLYNAALVATQGKYYDQALKFYSKLIDLGYTGISVNYYAVEKETGAEQVFQDKKSRDFSVDVIGTHESPRDDIAKSVEIDILRSIAAIYRFKENYEKSLEYLGKAKQINNDDINIILLESNVRWEMGDVDMYQKLISRALEIEPDNVDLIFNLGVINADKGEFEKALGFYNKAIEMNPEYTKAYLNAAALILDKEGPMVEQMNFLMEKGKWNSYDKLKLERDDLYRSAIPFLEKVIALDNKSYSAAKTLRNIYSQLDNEELYEKYKLIVENLEKE
tara:strand:+ start:495 stop:1766 length:1272 start_codon:yes stop_codon:yes gene_type:complete